MRRGCCSARVLLVSGLLLLAILAGLRHCSHPTPGYSPGSPSIASSPGARPLTLTFWNLEWFPGRRPGANDAARQRHVAAVVPVVERLAPDVLGLEEVADADAARLVTDHLKGFRVDVCSEYVRPNGAPTRQQIALCSRLPLVASRWENWQPGSDGLQPRRGFAFAAYQPTPGELLLVYALHLKSNLPDEPGGAAVNIAMREESARQLLAHERAMATAYGRTGRVRLAVIGGDMNTSLDDSRFAQETTLRSLLGEGGFLWAWRGVPLERRYTLPAEGRYPAVCFDHQLYRAADSGVRVLNASIEDTGHDASDHRPVTVRYTW